MDLGYSNTSYGAGGGANGGGFMPGGSQGGGESGGAKRSYGKDTLRPVTIRQLLDAHHPHPDAEYFMIDGAEATQVTIVGQVRNIAAQTTNVTYTLDDGTGTMEAKVWVDNDAQMQEDEDGGASAKPKPAEQGYARVWGRLKAFNNKRHLGAQVIRPVTDYNEVSCHLLEATAVHLYFTRGPVGQQQSKGGAVNGQPQQNGNSNSASAMPSGLSRGAVKVLECIKTTPQTQDGLHANDIAMRTSMEMTEVLKAGDELQNHGVIYTTVDDHTWALLEVS